MLNSGVSSSHIHTLLHMFPPLLIFTSSTFPSSREAKSGNVSAFHHSRSGNTPADFSFTVPLIMEKLKRVAGCWETQKKKGLLGGWGKAFPESKHISAIVRTWREIRADGCMWASRPGWCSASEATPACPRCNCHHVTISRNSCRRDCSPWWQCSRSIPNVLLPLWRSFAS